MTPLRLFVNAVAGGSLLFAFENLVPVLLGRPAADSGFLAQSLACFAEVLLAGWFLWLAAARVRTRPWRTIFVGSLGLFASLVANLPLWNHGERSGSWLLEQIAQNVLGFTLVGFFLAWRMKPAVPVPGNPPSTR
ncbi:MAG: hypothetical protein IPJ19_17440 [Planctomycetes bacterium]|nr:hypothetical protein [Planctomycetota bacterium]